MICRVLLRGTITDIPGVNTRKRAQRKGREVELRTARRFSFCSFQRAASQFLSSATERKSTKASASA